MAPFEIYYDGACPICRREMRFAKWLDPNGRRFTFVDIAAPDFADVGVDHASLVRTIHARRGSEMISGVEVFREVYSRFGLGLLMRVTRLRPIAWCLDAIYARYAVWRMRRREACTDDTCAV